MNSLVSITILVFAFLQIILFFKLWGMANNVKKISLKQLSFLDNKRIEEAQICLLKNESERGFYREKVSQCDDLKKFIESQRNLMDIVLKNNQSIL